MFFADGNAKISGPNNIFTKLHIFSATARKISDNESWLKRKRLRKRKSNDACVAASLSPQRRLFEPAFFPETLRTLPRRVFSFRVLA
jgi:hypothetical protein